MSGSRDPGRRGPASRRTTSRGARSRGRPSRSEESRGTDAQDTDSGGADTRDTDPGGDGSRDAGPGRDGAPDGAPRGPGTPGGRAGDASPGTDPQRARAGATAVADRPRRTSRDPAQVRFRRRRIAAALVTVAVLLACLAAGAWWALGRVGPGIDEVRVVGVAAIPAGDVRSVAAVPLGTPLAGVDTAAVAARVSGIPGVADVEVTRSWPHTLTITVSERIPVAVVDVPGEPSRLVDVTGLPYRDVPPQAPRLPRLLLPRVAPDDPATLAAVAAVAALPPAVRDQVDTVALGPTGATLELALTGDRRVLWGRWDGTDASAGPDSADTARRAAVLGPLLTREGSVYDVSSPELPTVRK